jgi:outer membrane protein TolC
MRVRALLLLTGLLAALPVDRPAAAQGLIVPPSANGPTGASMLAQTTALAQAAASTGPSPTGPQGATGATAPPATPAGPATRLTLQQAIDMARDRSESITVARAGETRASADQQRALSQKLPQLSFDGSYTRTLASEFSGAFTPVGPVCAPLNVDPNQSIEQRVAELERAASCGAIGGGPAFNLSNLPFGQRNVYQADLSFSQALYASGRISAQQRQADWSQRAAALGTSSAEAQVTLDVTQAFYDAALSDRLLAIAQSGYDQAAATYEQTRLSYEAGRQPEFELLRAQVARDNQQPTVIRSRANREIAYLRLRQLLKIPAGTPLVLDVDLDAPALPPPSPFAEGLTAAQAAGSAVERNAVSQAQAVVGMREAAVTVAHAARLPSVSLSSAYGRIAYPSSGLFPAAGDFRTNWSIGATVSMPIFNGNRLRADELSARADLTEAQANLQQSKELSVLDAATALEDLAASEATWNATAGTIEQAQRAYQIAELRNREGLSTQLELNDARLSLQQAEANRAQAARDLQVARARAALLPNLPVVTR